MTFRGDYGPLGYTQIESVTPVPASLLNVPWSPGFIMEAEDPVWGPGEFVYSRLGGSIPLLAICVNTPVWDSTNKVMQNNMTAAPNTANLGQALYVYMGNVAGTVGQYGWFMASGNYPVAGNATVAAATATGIAAAGQIGANSAGKQVLNARVAIPATQTVAAAQTGYGAIGDTTIGVASVSGFFPGAYISGTGVGTNAICTGVDPISKTITVSVVNSAQVTGNVTATYNNGTIFYNVLTLNRAFAQGAIT